MPETQASRRAADVLARIVETKRSEVRRLLPRSAEIRAAAESAPPPLDFAAALARPGEVALVAEVKRRSPGAGSIRPDLDPASLAAGYARRGAAAISVLTDEEHFGGSLGDLRAVRHAVDRPLLRKDFTVHEVQVAEARAAGADAILLIVRILEDDLLAELLAAARHYRLAPLVEVHDGAELGRALAAGARLIGINNRDLSTFATDVEVTVRLLDEVPDDAVVVSESGIREREEVERLGARGVHAVLVGEALLKAEDPAEAAARLVGCRRVERAHA